MKRTPILSLILVLGLNWGGAADAESPQRLPPIVHPPGALPIEVRWAGHHEPSRPHLDYTAEATKGDSRCRSGVFVSADFLYWKPRRGGLDFAISDPDVDSDVEGPIEMLEMESHAGVRGSIGYLTHSGWDIAFTYTHLDTDDNRIVTAPAGGQLWLTRTQPGSANTSAATAVAGAGLDYDVFDLEVGYWLFLNGSTSLRVFGGVRGATISEQFAVSYTGGTITTTRTQTHDTQLDGLGLRLGGQADWHWFSGLGLFARGAGSVVVGDVVNRYTEVEPGFAGGGAVDVQSEYFQTIPVIEVAAGIAWERGNWSMQAGYELTTWMNLDSRTHFTGTQTLNQGSFGSNSNDLGLDGLFYRLTWTR